ncbi:MAG TPA: cytidyltransferase [Bacillus sp. (in: firmicutes)]|nr:cytidyltransferase [Bacillus sp. (in: firmicutes)]
METIYLQHPISESVTAKMESCVLALGFFDGVHIGHKGILEAAKEMAKQKQLTFGVMTFYPHPKDIINPKEAPMKYLTPLPIKEERFQELGVEKLFVVKFNPQFAHLSSEDFVEQYILGLRCKHVVAGFDYHYGYKGKGSMATLAEEGQGRFDVTMIHKIEHGHEKISSTAIRHLLSVGNVGSIPYYLGDLYEIRGEVKENSLYYQNYQFLKILVDEEYRIPMPGVYNIQVEIDSRTYDGVCHQISQKDHQSSLLVQLADCLIDTYQKRIKVKWVQRVFGKTKEVHDMNQYMLGDKLVI